VKPNASPKWGTRRFGSLSNSSGGVLTKVLKISRDSIEILGASRALKVNGSSGNAGDVLISQSACLPPKWQADG
jgi:hypothetical protein